MSDPISPELFKHLVNLAALELDEQEGEYLLQQLNNQLKSIEELLAIPVDDATPLAAHGITYTPQISQEIRPDRWLPDPTSNEILRLAPESDDGYIIVPEIPHTDLG